MAGYRLSAAAQADIAKLLAHTTTYFGDGALVRYAALLAVALRDIASDPERHGTVAQPSLGVGVHAYHLRHSRQRAWHSAGQVARPRHLLLYRVSANGVVAIARVLHDATELTRHLARESEDV